MKMALIEINHLPRSLRQGRVERGKCFLGVCVNGGYRVVIGLGLVMSLMRTLMKIPELLLNGKDILRVLISVCRRVLNHQ
jgi:hypothetical protein